MFFPQLADKIPGSQFFTWKEALWLPKMEAFAAIPNDQIKMNIIKQAQELDRVRQHFNKPIVIHCWLRPPAYNELVQGAPKSAHIEGLATDFHMEGLDCEQVKKELQALGNKVYNGRGELNTLDWVHLDLRPGPWFTA